MLFIFDKRFAFFDPGIAFIELSEALPCGKFPFVGL